MTKQILELVDDYKEYEADTTYYLQSDRKSLLIRGDLLRYLIKERLIIHVTL